MCFDYVKTKGVVRVLGGEKFLALNVGYLTIHCWPWCTVCTFNSAHVASLSALYIHECVEGRLQKKK
jgi:hypothetical protein